ncbi:MAG: NUDIX hydrolase [Candidatus Eremiobacteraeota bacterium]|nr:NUDIX hydrolase [Candidatus Eremiobacteraeota bacterium]
MPCANEYEAAASRSAKSAMMEEPPRIVGTSRCFAGRVFNVRSDTLAFSDGAEHRIDVVEHGLSVAIVATPSPREIVLVRQYRHAARECVWEIPAGGAGPNEAPADAAARELREETGFSAARVAPIGLIWTTPGFCDEAMQFFHADGLTAGAQTLDADERIDIGIFDVEAAWRLVAARTADAKTILALFWLQGGRHEFGRTVRR